MEPVILIAVEALSVLDVSLQAQVLGLLDGACRNFSPAVPFITPDLREPCTRELPAAAPGRIQSSV